MELLGVVFSQTSLLSWYPLLTLAVRPTSTLIEEVAGARYVSVIVHPFVVFCKLAQQYFSLVDSPPLTLACFNLSRAPSSPYLATIFSQKVGSPFARESA